MADYFRLVPAGEQYFDDSGAILNGGKLYTYEAGTSTNKTTYQGDTTGDSAHANPIVLGSDGRIQSGDGVFGATGAFKLVLKDSADATIWTRDDVVGVGDNSNTNSEWVTSGLTPTYVGTTQFSVVGDQTALLHVNRRLRIVETAGTVYGTITATSYSDPNTTVTVDVDDSGTIDSGISAVSYGLISSVNGSGPVRNITVQEFTGNGTWTKPTDLHQAYVEVWGGGGAGGGAATCSTGESSVGGGGGAGGYAAKLIDTNDLGANETVTVGAGGAKASAAAGGAGGLSSFTVNGGSTLQATGGSGGGHTVASTAVLSSTMGNSGVGSNGDLNGSGGIGHKGIANGTQDVTVARAGGGAGGGAAGGVGKCGAASGNGAWTTSGDGNGSDASGYNAGGGGAANSETAANYSGGDGAPGLVRVTEYYGG